MNTPKARGRKRVRRDRSALYRKVCKLGTQLGNEKRRSQRYRKKLQRKTLAEEPTPQKKGRQLLRKCRVTPIVQKTLTFSTALIEGMKKRYRISEFLLGRRAVRSSRPAEPLCSAGRLKRRRVTGLQNTRIYNDTYMPRIYYIICINGCSIMYN